MKRKEAKNFSLDTKNSSLNDGATYKVPEAARVARVGAAAIRNGIKNGRIPHLRFGRNILIPKAAFHRWLDSCGQMMEVGSAKA